MTVEQLLSKLEDLANDPDYEPDHLGEIIIAKQRNGPTGVCKLQFHGPTTRFHNLAQGGDY